ncbi:MAG: hypothetical protein ACFFAH_11210 [Promethearchaeota archaeon]
MVKKTVIRKSHNRRGYIRKDGVRVKPTHVKPTRYHIEKKRPINVLIAHDNRLGYATNKAHKFAERISKDKNYNVILDQEYWKSKEITSPTETDRREKEMVKKADVIARIIPSPSKTGQSRHDGAQSEIRKGIKASKPIIEIFERGARDSPNRPLSEKNYSKKVPIHLKSKETLDKGFHEGIEKLEKKKLL